MRWKNFGEMSSDHRHKVYFSGDEDRHEYGVVFLVVHKDMESNIRINPLFTPAFAVVNE